MHSVKPNGLQSYSSITLLLSHLHRWDYERGWNETEQLNKRFGSFITNPELFDAPFFGVELREAAAMDAQQRLLLEGSWEALAHSLPRSRTGVFAYTPSLAYMYVMSDFGCCV